MGHGAGDSGMLSLARRFFLRSRCQLSTHSFNRREFPVLFFGATDGESDPSEASENRCSARSKRPEGVDRFHLSRSSSSLERSIDDKLPSVVAEGSQASTSTTSAWYEVGLGACADTDGGDASERPVLQLWISRTSATITAPITAAANTPMTEIAATLITPSFPRNSMCTICAICIKKLSAERSFFGAFNLPGVGRGAARDGAKMVKAKEKNTSESFITLIKIMCSIT